MTLAGGACRTTIPVNSCDSSATSQVLADHSFMSVFVAGRLDIGFLLTHKEVGVFACASRMMRQACRSGCAIALKGEVDEDAPISIAAAAALAQGMDIRSAALSAMVRIPGCEIFAEKLLMEGHMGNLLGVHTDEYDDLLTDPIFHEYHQHALSLLPKSERGRKVPKTFAEVMFELHHRQSACSEIIIEGSNVRSANTQPFDFSEQELQNELRRQNRTEVDLLFCVRWHLHQYLEDDLSASLSDYSVSALATRDTQSGCTLRRRLGDDVQEAVEDATSTAASNQPPSALRVSALIHFLLLESLGYFGMGDRGTTLFEAVFSRVEDVKLQFPCLFAIELMKFGLMHGDEYVYLGKDSQAESGDVANVRSSSVRLLTRMAALLAAPPSASGASGAKACGGTSATYVESCKDKDVAGFTTLLAEVGHAVRIVTESCVTSVIFQEVVHSTCTEAPSSEFWKQLSFPQWELQESSLAPLMLFFLEFRGTAGEFRSQLQAAFPGLSSPLDELNRLFGFWAELCNIVNLLQEVNRNELEILELHENVHAASELLAQRRSDFAL
mmetsp:Transcript_34903/g.81641  ORF Transcript_34903/g.81641 Transcript_34903/m.81641 type:complete len:556 (+) Transcript_34903:83-1750(+)